MPGAPDRRGEKIPLGYSAEFLLISGYKAEGKMM